MERIARLAIPKEINAAELPWNRRKGRSFERAERIVINLFVGPDPGWWTKTPPAGWEIIKVDILQHQDLLHDPTMAFLMDIARSGKVATFLAGPPCRSVSVLQLRNDGGPRQVRDRLGQGRWGKSDLKPHEQTLVDVDTQLLLRTLLLAELCEAAGPGETEFMVETPEDPAYYRDGENMPSFTVWPEVKQVLEVDLGLKRTSVEHGALGHERKKQHACGPLFRRSRN